MKLTTNYGPIESHATEAFYAAVEDTLVDVANAAPWRTGRYSKSLRVNRRKRSSGPTARINSRLPYAGALERGAWVRHGRGVHIARANAPAPLRMGTRTGVARTAEVFAQHYERRLGSTPIRSTAFVSHEFGGERGLPGLELGGL